MCATITEPGENGTFAAMRYFLDLSYDGNRYHGWQLQKNAHSVQAEVNRALSVWLQQEVNCVASGRTDTGVHARQQIVHFDSPKKLNEAQGIFKLNTLLPYDVAVHQLWEVPENSHARFDAVQRSYQYFIHQKKNAFLFNRSYYYTRPLNVDLMNEAGRILLQYENFQSFSRVKTEVNNFNCQIGEAYWHMENDSLIFTVSANRFLRGMVRALVGTILLVGEEKITLADFKGIIEARDRKQAGRAAPAFGLYLNAVKYPDHIYRSL